MGEPVPVEYPVDLNHTTSTATGLSIAATKVAGLSRWVDDANRTRGEALTWHRVAKVAEEAGEALSALLGVTGQNPRKGVTHEVDDVVEELLDTAIAALGAVEHLRGNTGYALHELLGKVDRVHARATTALIPLVDTEGADRG